MILWIAIALLGLVLGYLTVMWRVQIRRAGYLASFTAGIFGYRRSLAELDRELARMRRYQHSLSVVVLKPTMSQSAQQHYPNPNNGSDNGAGQSLSTSFPLLGYLLRDALREGDVIAYDATLDHYVIGLLETDITHASQLAQRLQALAQNRLAVQLQIGMAEFPTDGLTIEDLVRKAQTARELPPKAEMEIAVKSVEPSQVPRSMATTEAA
jgi:hypothetical protein